jgi:hypothetical protein
LFVVQKGVIIPMKKSLLMAGCGVLLGVSLLTGCGSKEEETEYNVESVQTEDSGEKMDNMQMVKVTKIDGSTITADVGESFGGGAEPQGSMEPPSQDGEKPDGDKADGKKPEGSMPPDGEKPEGSMEPPSQDGEKPDGDKADGKKPEGSMPPSQDGDDKGGAEFTSSGESITFEVTDSTEITTGMGDDAKTASLDDISEDSILMVSLDDNNQATKIMIQEAK